MSLPNGISIVKKSCLNYKIFSLRLQNLKLYSQNCGNRSDKQREFQLKKMVHVFPSYDKCLLSTYNNMDMFCTGNQNPHTHENNLGHLKERFQGRKVTLIVFKSQV